MAEQEQREVRLQPELQQGDILEVEEHLESVIVKEEAILEAMEVADEALEASEAHSACEEATESTPVTVEELLDPLEWPFVCEDSKRRFRTAGLLEKHRVLVYGEEEQLECEKCEAMFKRRIKLVQHLRSSDCTGAG